MNGFSIFCKSKNLLKELELINIVIDIIENKSATVDAATLTNA